MERKASKILGILAICLGWIIPIVGVTLGIIGLSIKKGNKERDVTLNTIGIIISIIAWIFWYSVLW